MVLRIQRRRPDATLTVPTLVGNPGKTTYPNNPYARNAWLLYPHTDSRLTIGMGDSAHNVSAPPIWNMNTSHVFSDDDGVTYADHQVDTIVLFDSTPYLLGHDPTSGTVGNLYAYGGSGQWTKTTPASLSSVAHLYSGATFSSAWWLAAGGTSAGVIARRSTDSGANWSTFNVPASGALIRPLRGWTMFSLGSTLYVSTNAAVFNSAPSGFTTDIPFINTFYWTGSQWDVTSFNFAPNDPLELEFVGETTRSGRIDKAVNFASQLVYLSARTVVNHDREFLSLYTLTDGGTPARVTDLEGTCYDLVVDGSRLLALCNRLEGSQYKVILYSTTNLTSWTKEITFYPTELNAFARRVAVFNGSYYFGLGCTYGTQSTASGDILRAA